MASFDPDDEFFSQLDEAVKNVTNIMKEWQKRDKAMNALAENHAKSSATGEPDEDLDAKTFSHKRALKRAIAERSKAGVGQPANGPQLTGGSPHEVASMQSVSRPPMPAAPSLPGLASPGPQQGLAPNRPMMA